ncbi:MAG: hypothetical protein ACXVDD_01495 [Polyangia bacterium]
MRKTTTLCLLVLASSIAFAQEGQQEEQQSQQPQPMYYPPPQPQYLQPPPPPPPTHLELRPNYALVFSGVGVFGLGYLLDVSSTLLVGHQPAWECAVPLVGPYLQVNDTFSKDWSDLAKGWYVFDGLVQTAGFVLTVVGASLWHKVPVRSAQNGLVVTF